MKSDYLSLKITAPTNEALYLNVAFLCGRTNSRIVGLARPSVRQSRTGS